MIPKTQGLLGATANVKVDSQLRHHWLIDADIDTDIDIDIDIGIDTDIDIGILAGTNTGIG